MGQLWGSGGLFGYYGLFRTAKLGKSTWYMTNRKHAVVVVTNAKTVLLSPDEVDGFLTAIRVAAPVPASSPDNLFLDSLTSSSSGSWGVVLAIVGAAIVIGAVSFTTAYSPGPPSYTLTAESLAIHDRFYAVTIPAASVDVGRIRIVDLASDPAWRPVSRTGGFANAHYRAGWFRVANGQKVRMYTATGSRLAFLPPKGNAAPVLLEVKDPDAFLAELRQAWLLAGG